MKKVQRILPYVGITYIFECWLIRVWIKYCLATPGSLGTKALAEVWIL